MNCKQLGHWDLTENILTNLEKVKELYLFTIEQQKRIDSLETKKPGLSQNLGSPNKKIRGFREYPNRITIFLFLIKSLL